MAEVVGNLGELIAYIEETTAIREIAIILPGYRIPPARSSLRKSRFCDFFNHRADEFWHHAFYNLEGFQSNLSYVDMTMNGFSAHKLYRRDGYHPNMRAVALIAKKLANFFSVSFFNNSVRRFYKQSQASDRRNVPMTAGQQENWITPSNRKKYHLNNPEATSYMPKRSTNQQFNDLPISTNTHFLQNHLENVPSISTQNKFACLYNCETAVRSVLDHVPTTHLKSFSQQKSEENSAQRQIINKPQVHTPKEIRENAVLSHTVATQSSYEENSVKSMVHSSKQTSTISNSQNSVKTVNNIRSAAPTNSPPRNRDLPSTSEKNDFNTSGLERVDAASPECSFHSSSNEDLEAQNDIAADTTVTNEPPRYSLRSLGDSI